MTKKLNKLSEDIADDSWGGSFGYFGKSPVKNKKGKKDTKGKMVSEKKPVTEAPSSPKAKATKEKKY